MAISSAHTFEIKVDSWILLSADASQVRVEVFVKEQGIAADLEWDALDAQVTHAVVYDHDQQPIATGRLIAPTMPEGPAKIGRMAVLKAFRGQGVGSQVLQALMIEATKWGYQQIELSAQAHAAAFYAQHGFAAEGVPYDDVGIAHVTMRYFVPQLSI
jgi:predicted GNAT family N-acyltransferase